MYLLGGEYFNNQGATNAVFQTNLSIIIEQVKTNIFNLVEKTPMHYKKYDFCLAILNNFIYVFGGKDENNYVVDTAEKYDILQDKWYILKSAETKRYAASAC